MDENYLAALADKYVAKLQISCQISRLCYEQDIAKIIRHTCQIIICQKKPEMHTLEE